jgi:hypothetical protein
MWDILSKGFFITRVLQARKHFVLVIPCPSTCHKNTPLQKRYAKLNRILEKIRDE